jgi:hypothetical protein
LFSNAHGRAGYLATGATSANESGNAAGHPNIPNQPMPLREDFQALGKL